MVHPLQRADIMAIQHDFAFQLVPVLLDVVVLHHDDLHTVGSHHQCCGQSVKSDSLLDYNGITSTSYQ